MCSERCRWGGKSCRKAAKKQRSYYSGKKKRHTQQSQLLGVQKTRELIGVAVGKGREQDGKRFKRRPLRIDAAIECRGAKGSQGIQNLHSKSHTPQKKRRGRELRTQEKQQNRALASRRVVCAHVRGQ